MQVAQQFQLHQLLDGVALGKRDRTGSISHPSPMGVWAREPLTLWRLPGFAVLVEQVPGQDQCRQQSKAERHHQKGQQGGIDCLSACGNLRRPYRFDGGLRLQSVSVRLHGHGYGCRHQDQENQDDQEHHHVDPLLLVIPVPA